MLARLRAIIACSRKALLFYTLFLVVVVIEAAMAALKFTQCLKHGCDWSEFMAYLQRRLEFLQGAAAVLIPALAAMMALEDSAQKAGPSQNPAPPAAHFPAPSAAATLPSTKESGDRVSIVKKEIMVSAPVYDLLKAVEEIAADALERKTGELAADVGSLVALFARLSEIPADFNENPEAVQNAVLQAGDDFVKRLHGILKKPASDGGVGARS